MSWGLTVGVAELARLPGLVTWSWFWVVPLCGFLVAEAALNWFSRPPVAGLASLALMAPLAALCLPVALANLGDAWPTAYEFRAWGFAPMAFTVVEIAHAIAKEYSKARRQPAESRA